MTAMAFCVGHWASAPWRSTGVTRLRSGPWVGYESSPRFSPREQRLGTQRDYDAIQSPRSGDERVGGALERVALL
jgi:hypothetical protein